MVSFHVQPNQAPLQAMSTLNHQTGIWPHEIALQEDLCCSTSMKDAGTGAWARPVLGQKRSKGRATSMRRYRPSAGRRLQQTCCPPTPAARE